MKYRNKVSILYFGLARKRPLGFTIYQHHASDVSQISEAGLVDLVKLPFGVEPKKNLHNILSFGFARINGSPVYVISAYRYGGIDEGRRRTYYAVSFFIPFGLFFESMSAFEESIEYHLKISRSNHVGNDTIINISDLKLMDLGEQIVADPQETGPGLSIFMAKDQNSNFEDLFTALFSNKNRLHNRNIIINDEGAINMMSIKPVVLIANDFDFNKLFEKKKESKTKETKNRRSKKKSRGKKSKQSSEKFLNTSQIESNELDPKDDDLAEVDVIAKNKIIEETSNSYDTFFQAEEEEAEAKEEKISELIEIKDGDVLDELGIETEENEPNKNEQQRNSEEVVNTDSRLFENEEAVSSDLAADGGIEIGVSDKITPGKAESNTVDELKGNSSELKPLKKQEDGTTVKAEDNLSSEKPLKEEIIQEEEADDSNVVNAGDSVEVNLADNLLAQKYLKAEVIQEEGADDSNAVKAEDSVEASLADNLSPQKPLKEEVIQEEGADDSSSVREKDNLEDTISIRKPLKEEESQEARIDDSNHQKAVGDLENNLENDLSEQEFLKEQELPEDSAGYSPKDKKQGEGTNEIEPNAELEPSSNNYRNLPLIAGILLLFLVGGGLYWLYDETRMSPDSKIVEAVLPSETEVSIIPETVDTKGVVESAGVEFGDADNWPEPGNPVTKNNATNMDNMAISKLEEFYESGSFDDKRVEEIMDSLRLLPGFKETEALGKVVKKIDLKIRLRHRPEKVVSAKNEKLEDYVQINLNKKINGLNSFKADLDVDISPNGMLSIGSKGKGFIYFNGEYSSADEAGISFAIRKRIKHRLVIQLDRSMVYDNYRLEVSNASSYGYVRVYIIKK